MNPVHLLKTIVHKLADWQKRYAVIILVIGIILGAVCYPRAVRLLGNVKTDLIHLLPDHYPSVHFTEEIQKKFNRRSSMYLIVNSPDEEANKKAIAFARDYLLKNLSAIDYIEDEKTGYEFFDDNKLLLIDLEDLYTIQERLKDKIQKKKLGGLYIDLEEDQSKDIGFDDIISKYREEFTEGVKSKHKSNEDGTVFVLNIYPKNTDSSLKFFKMFGKEVQDTASGIDFTQFHPQMTVGYAGAIITRVDQYDALMRDLQRAGVVSGITIFLLLYLYFSRYVATPRGGWRNYLKIPLYKMVPVTAIFIPMLISTFVSFWFCSFFFDSMNVVTSFLFAILFGLGVDIGIHLITRYIHDRGAGMNMDQIHYNVLVKTGKSCSTAILTTVASFYILTINDFKGFSEFGWIAGHGMVIALACYLIFFPCVMIIMERFRLMPLRETRFDLSGHDDSERRWIPKAKWITAGFVLITAASLFFITHLQFEWNFNKLKMKLPEREHQKDLLKQTHGRVNSPAVYLIENQIQSMAIKREIRKRKESDKEFPTIHYYRSYYDMVPFDQDEKLALLKQIDELLADDALNVASDNEKKLIADFRDSIAKTKRLVPGDIPKEIAELFWGNTGTMDSSVAYIMPLAHLELDNGYNAKAFYDDVYDIKALGKQFYALSDSIVFAEVLQTLMRDSKIAIVCAFGLILIFITIDLRDFRRVAFVSIALGSGIVWMLGLMQIFDVKLNFYNMIIIPAMIGMGEDNSIHVIHRFDEIKQRSILTALRTSGGAAMMASLTTILGYSGMLFTNHPGLRSIGYMAIIGMGTCLIASLVFLPLMLQLFRKKESEPKR